MWRYRKEKPKQGPLYCHWLVFDIGGPFFIAPGLFGSTGYVTEVYRSERVGGSQNINGNPNAYYWQVSYIFKTKSGEIETGSVQVVGDAISSKSGIRTGSRVRYLALNPGWNRPGDAGVDWSGVAYLVFGVPIFIIGVKKPKPVKTPSQRSHEYRAAKENRQTSRQIPRQTTAVVPDWDSFEYDDTPLTAGEYDQLISLLTEEEWVDEFELVFEENAMDAVYCRKVFAIVSWRRANIIK